MLFFAPGFIVVFLPLVLLAFWIARKISLSAAIVVLLVASIIFLGYRTPRDVAVFALSLAGNYIAGEALGRNRSKTILAAGVAFNLLLLGYFKYLTFLNANLAGTLGPLQSAALPLAISFYTFNQIGYLVARYRREVMAHGFIDYALFVAFFPHLIAETQRRALPPSFADCRIVQARGSKRQGAIAAIIEYLFESVVPERSTL